MAHELLASLAGSSRPTDSIEQGSLADRIYTDLRHDLLLGTIPFQERLPEEQLAEKYGCSRTPVREALHRLTADGHLIKDASGSMIPNPPQTSTMHDFYELRQAIEGLVVRRASKLTGDDTIDALRRDWTDLRDHWNGTAGQIAGPDFVFADEAFHESIAEASGNTAAARMLREINERIRALRIHDFMDPDRVVSTISEHIEIATAIVAGRTSVAADLMRAHIDRSALVVELRVGAMLARMFDLQADGR